MLSDYCTVFALGQCGNRIGSLLSQEGFDVNYANFDEVDIRGMDIPEDKLLLLEKTGTGGSFNKGKQMIESHKEEFEKFLTDRLQEHKINLFIVGLGGGSGGSMVTSAVEIAKEGGYKTMVLATLPPKIQGLLANDNAMRSLKSLKQIGPDGFILADNEHLINTIGISSEWWKEINNYIISKIVLTFDILREDKNTLEGLGSIDKGELLRILQYGNGMLDIRDVYFDINNLNLEEDEIKKKIFGHGMVQGYNYRDTLAYLISVDIPVGGVYTAFAEKVLSVTKKTCGSAISRLGMFNDPKLKSSIRVTIANAGLKLPKVLNSRMNNLKRDLGRHSDKKNKEGSVDLSDIDNLSIDDDFDI